MSLEYMSSWANRNIPRKRDLSQIPSEFRPTIVPRVHRPEVILSEKYQDVPMNEVIYPSMSFEDMYNVGSYRPNDRPHDRSRSDPKKAELVDKRQYQIKKIEIGFSPKAIELSHQDKSYVFVILRHIGTTRDNDLWITSYNMIRRFYTNKIIIIDDNSTINTVNGKLTNAEVIQSECNGAGEILPYYYFLKNKWADRMIFVHDSMFLHRRFTEEELDRPVSFHWHFNSEEFKGDRKIATYLTMLPHAAELVEYAAAEDWKGCFGGASIIDLSVVEMLEENYQLFSKLILSIRNRKDRETFERVLGILLCREGLVDPARSSNFGAILRYPKAFESDSINYDTAAHILSQAKYDTAIIKVWRGR